MEKEEQNDGDVSPAVPLEISAELVTQVDDQLRDFAEDAELETALVVDQSGAVVSGISSEEEVTIEVISALVAGACGAMRALVSELGETSGIESFHQGENRVVYLSEIIHRFVLVGVCRAGTPVGVIRETANQIKPALVDLLVDLEVPALPAEPDPPKRSFRRITASAASVVAMQETPFTQEVEMVEDAREEAEAKEAIEEPEEEAEVTEKSGEVHDIEVEGDAEDPPAPEEVKGLEEEVVTSEDAVDNLEGQGVENESIPEVPEPSAEESEPFVEDAQPSAEEPEPIVEEAEPVIEILDFGEPEIVIESSVSGTSEEVSESIFEMADEADAESTELDESQASLSETADSIFELESEPAERISDPGDSPGIFEVDEEDSSLREPSVEREDSLEPDSAPSDFPNIPGAIESVPEALPENIFELEEESVEEEYMPLKEVKRPMEESVAPGIFEIDEEEPDTIDSPAEDSGEEEEQEQEGGISRPQYF